jgi:chromate transporter
VSPSLWLELLEMARVYATLSLLAIGGGIAALPAMERQVVVEHGWLTHREFVDSFALGQLTPGPGFLMVALAGYRVAGVLGATVALVAAFTPTCLLTWLLAARWERWRRSPLARAVEQGLGPVAVGLLVSGAIALGRAALTDALTVAIALGGTLILWRFGVTPALIVFGGGAIGWLAGRF